MGVFGTRGTKIPFARLASRSLSTSDEEELEELELLEEEDDERVLLISLRFSLSLLEYVEGSATGATIGFTTGAGLGAGLGAGDGVGSF